MSGGFGSGLVAGFVTSVVVAAAVSLVLPLSPLDPADAAQTDFSTPAGSGFNAGKTDTDPVLTPIEKPDLPDSAVKPQGSAPVAAPPAPDTSSPRSSAAVDGTALPQIDAGNTDVAVATPSFQTPPRPATSGTVTAPSLTDTPVVPSPPPAPPPPPPVPAATPGDGAGTEAPAQPTAPIVPQTAPREADESPETTAPAPVPGEAPAAEAETAPGPEAAPLAVAGNALADFSVDFANAEGLPVMAIVLIDRGRAGLDRELITTFTFPVTIAIDPAMEDAAERAAFFRDAGFEVAVLAPETLNPAEMGPALSAGISALVGSIAVVDRTTAGIQNDAALTNAVLATTAQSGHGVLFYDAGLNPALKAAERAGVASGAAFRVLDGEGESSLVIKRYLDRAALKAGQEGSVVMVGTTAPETVTALFSWSKTSKANGVALAPLSAVLSR